MNARSIGLRGPPRRRSKGRARAPDPAPSCGRGPGKTGAETRASGSRRARSPAPHVHLPLWPRRTPRPAPSRPAPLRRARTRPAAGRWVGPQAEAAPRARCPSRRRPLGGAPLPPRAPTGGPLAPACESTPTPGRARLLPEGRRGLRGLKQDGGRRRQARELAAAAEGSGTGARPRAPDSRLLSGLRARAQPCCRAPPASPHLITTAPGVRWPRADSAAIGPAGSAARQDWLGGGASAEVGAGPRREAGREVAGAGPGRGPRLCAQRALSVRSGCINNSERQRRRQRRVRAGGGGSSGDRAAAAMHPSEAEQPRHP